MQKPAETEYPIHDMLERRWSTVAFAERLIEPWKIQSILEAARWAPSSRNEQPWRFITAVRDNPDEFAGILNCLVPANVVWAQHAPMLILSAAKMNFDHKGQPNRHAFYDVGQAVSQMIFQATALGVFSHQMAGFDADKARKDLLVPEGYEPVSIIVLGYPGNAEQLPQELKQREAAPRTRKQVKEFLFQGKWGTPSPLFAGPG